MTIDARVTRKNSGILVIGGANGVSGRFESLADPSAHHLRRSPM
jgi:hypothetical protein